MYRLPPGLDLSCFVGKTLVQICVGASDLIFNFDGELSVTLTSSLGCRRPGGRFRRHKDLVLGSRTAMGLLNKTVVSAEGLSDGTLRVHFVEDGLLEFYDDSDRYESYVIRSGDHLIVV